MTIYEQQFMETIIRELPKITKQLENISTKLDVFNAVFVDAAEEVKNEHIGDEIL